MSRGQCLGASMLALVLSGGSFAMSDEPKQQAARPSRQYTIEQFLATTTISGPTLSPDGSKVAFTSDASGIPNVYSVSFTGGAIAPLTKSTTDSTYSVSYFPRDERLLFTHDKGGDEQNHLFVLDKGAETDITPGKSLKAAFANWTTDDLAFFTLSNERDPRFFDVYRHVTADYKRSLVYENKSGSMPSAVSGDGRWVALDKPRTTSDSDIQVWDASTQKATLITPHSTPAAYHVSGFDPDSRFLYYLTNAGSEFTRVKRYEMATGKHEDVETADWDVVFTRFSRKGRYRITAVNEDGRTVIKMRDTRSDKIVPMPKLPDGDITSVVISHDEERMVVSLSGDRSPTNLYASKIGAADATKLTDSLSKAIDPNDLVESQVVRFKSSDGLTIPSIFYKPHDATPRHKVPALVWVHGGPGGQTRKGYSRVYPVPGQSRVRRARHQQSRQLGLRPDLFHGR